MYPFLHREGGVTANINVGCDGLFASKPAPTVLCVVPENNNSQERGTCVGRRISPFLASVLSVGLALGVSMPLVSLRLEGWGYGSFAIGVMAAMPAIGVLLGAKISSHLAARLGTANLMRLCLWAGAVSIGLLAVWPSYPIWLVLRLMIGVILTLVFILGESWINQLVVEQWRGRLVALYGSSYALSQLAGPLLLGALGTEHDYGFWVGVGLLMTSPFLLLGRGGAPTSEACSVTLGDLLTFCRGLPAIAWRCRCSRRSKR